MFLMVMMTISDNGNLPWQICAGQGITDLRRDEIGAMRDVLRGLMACDGRGRNALEM